MLESAATGEKKEERDRDKLGDKLEAFLKRKEEEDEARRIKVCAALLGNTSIDRDRGRARTLMTKCWQSMQSRET